jgi:hypothetical protein
MRPNKIQGFSFTAVREDRVKRVKALAFQARQQQQDKEWADRAVARIKAQKVVIVKMDCGGCDDFECDCRAANRREIQRWEQLAKVWPGRLYIEAITLPGRDWEITEYRIAYVYESRQSA